MPLVHVLEQLEDLLLAALELLLALPEGVDLVYESVGGDVLEAGLTRDLHPRP